VKRFGLQNAIKSVIYKIQMSKLFQKKVEDFVCEKCGTEIKGSGYTNHCHKCLWSKHVDINPGDREAVCCGLMEPIDIELKDGIFYVVHKCIKCPHIRKNKLEKGDNFDVAVKIREKIGNK